jgi:hypothetical protein
MSPLRILFSMLHPGYVRNYESTIRLLAERGHAIHVVFAQPDKQAGDRVIERLATEFPTVTFGTAPKRAKGDPWRGFLWMVRALADAARYRHPRFAAAPLLRQRVEGKIRDQCASDKTSALLAAATLRTLDRLERVSTPKGADRATRWLLALEDLAPESDMFLTSISSFGADVVLVTPLVNVASMQTDYFRAARRLGVPAAVCVASWDNLTNKGMLRGRPDGVFVWNEIQRREAIEMHGVSPERVIATGAPRFDEWFARHPSTTASVFAERVGLDPERTFLAYLCSSPFIAPDEVSFVRRWLTALRNADDPRLRDIGVLVRPHPQNAAGWASADLSGFGNAVVHPRGGEQPANEDARALFYDSIAHSAAVVGINTTALLESAILRKSVFTMLAPEFAGTQEGTLHYRYLQFENGGFLHEAETLEAHLEQVSAALERNSDRIEQSQAFVQKFLRPSGLAIESTPLLVAAIERLAADPVAPERASPTVLAVRLPLGVAARIAVVRRSIKVRRTIPPVGLARPRRRLRHAYARIVVAQPRHRARRAFVRVARNPLIRPVARRAAKHPWGQGLARRVADRAVVLDASLTSEQRDATEAIIRTTELARRAHGTLLVGPWTGDRASEALIWVPFLRWLSSETRLTSAQLVAIAPAAREALYRGVCDRVVDEGDSGGGAHLSGDVVAGLLGGWEEATLPMQMLLQRTTFTRLPAPSDPVIAETLPHDYVAVRVAFGSAFPDTRENRSVLERIVATLAESEPVVILGDRLEDLPEPPATAFPDSAEGPELTVLGRARAVVTPLDQDAFSALVFGVPTIALHSDPSAAADPRVAIAGRAARDLDTPFVVVSGDALAVLSAIATSPTARLRG